MGVLSEIGDFFSDAFDGSKDIFDAITGGQGAANQANRELSQEYMAWQERMSNTSMQRRVEDLKKAGLNPMLAYMSGGASQPSGSPAQMQATRSVERGAEAFSAVSAARQAQANTELTKASVEQVNAQTAKTSAEAELVKSQVPYSGFTAQMSAKKLSAEYTKLGLEVDKALSEADVKDMEVKQLEKLQPLVVEYQRLQNEAKRLGLPAAEAEAKFWSTVPETKFLQVLKQLLPAMSIRSHTLQK